MLIEGTETPRERRRRKWAENLVSALGTLDMTPQEFHADLRHAGVEVTIQSVYMWLNGTTSPSVDHQTLIARTLRTPHHLLFPAEIGDAA